MLRPATTIASRHTTGADGLVVLFDRDCGICQWVAAQLRSLDRHRRLELLSFQAAGTDPSRPDLGDFVATHPVDDALHAVTSDGRVFVGGGAALAILDRLPAGWLLRPWVAIPGVRALVDVGYRLVARNRQRISSWIPGAAEAACAVPLSARGATPDARRPASPR
jgi:predicted DCC family thiol-disulfide oxidoreductase YuxK